MLTPSRHCEDPAKAGDVAIQKNKNDWIATPSARARDDAFEYGFNL